MGRALVVGAGVIGLSTALALRLLGHDVDIRTISEPRSDGDPAYPLLASRHAAASVIPHSVEDRRAAGWSAQTQRVFQSLARHDPGWLRLNRHYEMFEDAGGLPPDYLAGAIDVREVRLSGPTTGIPSRAGSEAIGWSFDCWFVEAPIYLDWLREQLQILGVPVLRARESLDTLGLDNCDAAFLCAGQATPALVSSLRSAGLTGGEELKVRGPETFTVGHYVRMEIDGLLRDQADRTCSYNYTPRPARYSTGAGLAADVYCYPRESGWLLGGSRLSTTRGAEAAQEIAFNYEGPSIELPYGLSDHIRIPEAILSLNSEIIDSMTDGRINLMDEVRRHPERVTAGLGIRYQSGWAEGAVHLERSAGRSAAEPNQVIVNYGHGGAGFTLSWGSVLSALALAASGGFEHSSLGGEQLRNTGSEVRALGSILSKELGRILESGLDPGRTGAT